MSQTKSPPRACVSVPGYTCFMGTLATTLGAAQATRPTADVSIFPHPSAHTTSSRIQVNMEHRSGQPSIKGTRRSHVGGDGFTCVLVHIATLQILLMHTCGVENTSC
jgi:hypothetical protein